MIQINKKSTRLFISFSSKDIPFVREIMSGLQFQHFDFWDYSDELQQIRLTEDIKKRLIEEIDGCDYFVALVSKNSTSENAGLFTRFEVDYVVNTKKLQLQNRVITIELENTERSDYLGPYAKLKNYLHHDFVWNSFIKESVKSYISLIKNICQVTGHTYIPQITAHHRLPFWEKFRDEVISFAHSNHEHTFLMNVLGEFNEFFKKEAYDLAYESITYFIASCTYLLPEYKLIYPWIVKAVSEQNKGRHKDAKASYEAALKNEPGNPDALGGIGMVYLNTGNFVKAVEFFKNASEKSSGAQKINERLNMIIAKISGRIKLTGDEKTFVKDLDMIDVVLDDQNETFEKNLISFKNNNENFSAQQKKRFEEQRIFVLSTKALVYFNEWEEHYAGREFNKSEEALRNAHSLYAEEIKEKNLPNAVTVYYYYHTCRFLGQSNPEQILKNAIERFEAESPGEKLQLLDFLADHYLTEGEFYDCISIYENHLLDQEPSRRMLINYTRALKQTGNQKFSSVCFRILNPDETGYPETPEDYYWNGFANYLLGNFDRAKYDYERSNNFDKYYSQLNI